MIPNNQPDAGHAVPEADRGDQVGLGLDVLPGGARLPRAWRTGTPARSRWPSSCRRSSGSGTRTASTRRSPAWGAPGTGTPRGRRSPSEGVVQLALGLGKPDRGRGKCWTYSPAHPRVDPPFTTRDLLQQTQTKFWAVNMGRPPAFDPTRETEYLEQADLKAAETGRLAARSWRAPTTPRTTGSSWGSAGPGPRVLNFAPDPDDARREAP